MVNYQSIPMNFITQVTTDGTKLPSLDRGNFPPSLSQNRT